MLKNTIDNFGMISKLFHWLMFALFLIMFPLGYFMRDIANENLRHSAISFHRATGFLLFCLIIFRMLWRYINISPALSSTLPRWQRRSASLNVFVLYCLMLAMPFSGLVMSLTSGHDISFYGLFIIPAIAKNRDIAIAFATMHKYISYLLLAAISVHIIGALYHYFYLRDNVFKRILPT